MQKTAILALISCLLAGAVATPTVVAGHYAVGQIMRVSLNILRSHDKKEIRRDLDHVAVNAYAAPRTRPAQEKQIGAVLDDVAAALAATRRERRNVVRRAASIFGRAQIDREAARALRKDVIARPAVAQG